MLELVLKITICHLLGDFVFQTDRMVKDMNKNKLKSKSLYIHVIIHLILILFITKFDKQYILPAILLTISHLIIDIVTKIIIRNKISSIYSFLIDQFLHFAAIYLFIRHFFNFKINYSIIFSNKNYLLIISLISIVFVSGILIKKLLDKFSYEMKHEGLKNAGYYIGILERLFVFIFVISSFWEGIGFLLAAKSIFRFGDLKENKEIKLTEYILIGTLLSFGIAILIGQLYLYVKSMS